MSDEKQDNALDFVAYRKRSEESAAIIRHAATTLNEWLEALVVRAEQDPNSIGEEDWELVDDAIDATAVFQNLLRLRRKQLADGREAERIHQATRRPRNKAVSTN